MKAYLQPMLFKAELHPLRFGLSNSRVQVHRGLITELGVIGLQLCTVQPAGR